MNASARDDATTGPRADWARMRELAAEVEALRDEGRWTRAEFDRVEALALQASNRAPGSLDWLIQEADPSWVELRPGD